MPINVGGASAPIADRCDHGLDSARLSRVVGRNGATMVRRRCPCGGIGAVTFVSNAIIQRRGIVVGDLPLERDNRPTCCGGTGCPQCAHSSCERCGSCERVELHHWAPWHLFDDANDWPTSWLCASCHREWHRLVTPNMARKVA